MIRIDKYDAVIENNHIVYYAIAGKKKYKMPDYYKDMYDEHHLAIEERSMSRPELFDCEPTHYIPIFTE